jgi:hypothetical protein
MASVMILRLVSVSDCYLMNWKQGGGQNNTQSPFKMEGWGLLEYKGKMK